MRSSVGLTIRRAAALALAAGALTAVVAAAPASAAVPACQTRQLVVWIDTRSNGAAGTIVYTLNFTNVGARCTLRGYPGVSAVSQTGGRLGRAATRNPGTRVKTVTLSPAAGSGLTRADTAQTMIGITDTGVLSPAACRPTTASGLRVYPPNQRAAALVPYPFPACSLASARILSVRAVTRAVG